MHGRGRSTDRVPGGYTMAATPTLHPARAGQGTDHQDPPCVGPNRSDGPMHGRAARLVRKSNIGSSSSSSSSNNTNKPRRTTALSQRPGGANFAIYSPAPGPPKPIRRHARRFQGAIADGAGSTRLPAAADNAATFFTFSRRTAVVSRIALMEDKSLRPRGSRNAEGFPAPYLGRRRRGGHQVVLT